MLRKYKITYRVGQGLRTVIIEATSKYNAKQKFYIQHPKSEIVRTEIDSSSYAERKDNT